MEGQSNFKKSYDEVLLVYTILKRLGAGLLNTFDDRIRNQKIQYLAQVFKVSPIYDFSLYVRGPYSPDLTHDLYEVEKIKESIQTENFSLETLEDRFSNLKSFIKNKSTRELELIATLHWFMNVLRYSIKEVETEMIRLKSITNDEFKKTLEELGKLNGKIKA